MESKPKAYLILRTEETAGCSSGTVLRIELGVCEWRYESPRGLSGYNDPADSIAWMERIYSDRPKWTTIGELSARELYCPSASDLRALVKLMDSIERKLGKLRDQAGAPGSLGAAALRFARAVGAVGIIRKTKTLPNGRSEWQQLGADMIEYVVDGTVHEFRKRFTESTETAAA